MKSENELITNTDRVELLKAIIINTLKLKNTVYVNFGFEIDHLNHEKIMYDGYYHQIFDAKTILDNFDDIAKIIKNQSEFNVSLFDDFSSYIQMYDNFELKPENFCYTFIFHPTIYHSIRQDNDKGSSDIYYYIKNAYTVSINTTVFSEDGCILDNLTQMLGMDLRHDFNVDLAKLEYVNIVSK